MSQQTSIVIGHAGEPEQQQVTSPRPTTTKHCPIAEGDSIYDVIKQLGSDECKSLYVVWLPVPTPNNLVVSQWYYTTCFLRSDPVKRLKGSDCLFFLS